MRFLEQYDGGEDSDNNLWMATATAMNNICLKRFFVSMATLVSSVSLCTCVSGPSGDAKLRGWLVDQLVAAVLCR